MQNNIINYSVSILNNLYYSITRLRLENEKQYYDSKIMQTSPKTVCSSDKIFDKLKKGSFNFFNNGTYNKYLEKKKNIVLYINDYITKNSTLIYYNENEIQTKCREVFKDDYYGIAKLEFAMNIVTDSDYEYETNAYSFYVISSLLDLNESYLMNTYNMMKKIYSEISLNKKTIGIKAIPIASLVAIVLIISGVGAAIGGYAVAGSVTTAGLAGVSFGMGMAEGVAVLCVASAIGFGVTYGATYAGLTIAQKRKLKEEFAKLSIDQMVMSLVKTIMFMLHMRKFKDDKAKELYNSYVEEYIDLKYDCDIRLFLKEEKVLENKDKNRIFANVDEFLKKNLFSV